MSSRHLTLAGLTRQVLQPPQPRGLNGRKHLRPHIDAPDQSQSKKANRIVARSRDAADAWWYESGKKPKSGGTKRSPRPADWVWATPWRREEAGRDPTGWSGLRGTGLVGGLPRFPSRSPVSCLSSSPLGWVPRRVGVPEEYTRERGLVVALSRVPWHGKVPELACPLPDRLRPGNGCCTSWADGAQADKSTLIDGHLREPGPDLTVPERAALGCMRSPVLLRFQIPQRGTRARCH